MPERSITSRQFFEQHERARMLRNLCLRAIDAAEAIISSTGDADTRIDVYNFNAQLSGLGIEPGMHTFTDDDPDAQQKTAQLLADPVRAAEYVAGQVRQFLERSLFSKGLSSADLAEHDKLNGRVEQAYLLDMQTASPAIRAAAVDLGTINILRIFLAAKDGPSEE